MGKKKQLIVVIEDNPTDVFLIQEALAAQGVETDLKVLEDGEEAMKMIAATDEDATQVCPSLMLLDLNLPKSDGFAVLDRIRHSRRCARVPVIVMTSSAATTDREKSSTLGASAYFQKPSQYDAFLEIGRLVKSHLH